MKIAKSVVLAAILTIFGVNAANAQSLGNLLGGDLGNTIGNLIEGVFSSSNITVADMQGEWTSDGPAVCFQGEGFLKKAGGAAAAAAIETKLSPYYAQLGFNNATLTVDADANFTLTLKSIKLKGTITQAAGAEPGVFEFNFTVLGQKIAGVTTYVQKTSKTMDVMFDATKLKKLLSALSSFSGMKTIQAISSILDSYDGLCVGFHMSGGSTTTQSSSGFSLLDILSGGKSNSNSSSTTENKSETESTEENTQTGNQSTGLGILRSILTGGSKK